MLVANMHSRLHVSVTPQHILGGLVEELEQLLLDLKLFNNRLDDQIGILGSLGAVISSSSFDPPVRGSVDPAHHLILKLLRLFRRGFHLLGDALQRCADVPQAGADISAIETMTNSRAFWCTSTSLTFSPAAAATWAMPAPIRPAPKTVRFSTFGIGARWRATADTRPEADISGV